MKKSKILVPSWVPKLVLLFLVVIGVLLYSHLGRDPLFDWDEGIYAELGRELIETGQVFTNTWNYSPWFEKPPGISWLTAVGQAVGGQTAFGARLFQPLVTLMVLWMLYKLGTKLKNWRVGLLAMGFLAGFNLFLGRARAVNTDMPLLLGIVTSLYLIITNRKPWMVAAVVALSIWFKGTAGLLPLLISFPLFFTKSKKYTLHTMYYLLLTIIPWHLLVFLRSGPEFYRPYLLEQVVQRATVPIEFHLESRWFYFSYLYENLGLGMIIGLVLGVLLIAREFLKSRDLQKATILWWLLLPLGLFTLAKTRLFWYILPVYPAIALILAYLLDAFSTNPISRKVLTILAVGVLFQAGLTVSRSVELSRPDSPTPDRLQVVSSLSGTGDTLAVLVPPTERVAEAVLPQDQRISSSFRYGGMPSIVYYYRGPVRFFYNVDEFNEYWESGGRVGMLSVLDSGLVPDFDTVVETESYLGISKEDR